MVQEEIRKGPWTEQEDGQLVFYVNLFGDRRWDFVAKVSGLKVEGDRYNRYDCLGNNMYSRLSKFNPKWINCFVWFVGLKRTGKSCRLRWVNYLHPGLKRGKMTPHEERLVVELHSKFGNRWSRIARKLPGRTDNEIKNYWRTRMRKKAQEKKKASSLSPSSSSSSSLTSCSSNSSSIGNSPAVLESVAIATQTKGRNLQEAGGYFPPMPKGKKADEAKEDWDNKKVHLMDEVWKDYELCSMKPFNNGYYEKGENYLLSETMASPLWDMPLWATDEEESNMFPHTTSDQLYSFHNQEIFYML